MKHLGTCLAAALICHSASADMQLTMKDKSDDRMEQASETTISVRDGKVLFQSKGNGGDAAMVYDESTGSLTQIDHKQKMYMVMDKETMSEAANKVSAMMKQVEAQLANLPKEQREMMMKSMPGMEGMGQEKKKVSYDVEWTGEKKEVAGFPCKVATVKENGDADGTACIAKPKDLGMSDKDFETLAGMFDAMTDFANSVSGDSGMPDMREIGGFPIETSDGDGGSHSVLTSASDASLDGDIFEVPASYKRQSMPGM